MRSASGESGASGGSSGGGSGGGPYGGSNPICRLFQLKRQTGSAGQELLWRVIDAVRIDDGKECSIFIFDKKIAEKLHKPKRKETVSEVLRREVRYLERFKHPKLLQIWHPVEECNESLAFATEPVWGSLANFLGNHERVAQAVPPELKEGFTDLEIKHGIHQVNEALKYLHSTQKVIHGNLNLGSVLITKRGCWKLSGLGFVEKSSSSRDSFTQWTPKLPKMAQPDLDFMAPDLQIHGKATQACDIFSLGLVIHAVFNGGVSFLESRRSCQQYHRRVEELPVNLPKALTQLPCELSDLLEKMLDRDPKHRPSAQLLSMNKYFQDPLLLALEGLTTCEAKSMEQKKEFFGLLMQTMMREQFPKSILFKRVCPLIAENLQVAADLTPYVLPCLLRAAMQCGPDEFRLNMREPLLGVLRRPKSAQTSVVLVEHTDVLVEKLDDEEIRSDILPLVFSTLESSSATGQEAALNAFSVLQEHIDDATLRKLILPKAKSVFQRSTSLTMRMKALTCLEQLMDRLDKMTILEDVLPFLLDISFSDPDIYMAVINIYKRMLTDKKFGLTYNLIATKVLPHLIPYTVNPNLRRDDFRCVMETLNAMWGRLETGRAAQMKLEDADGNDSVDESGNLMRPPMITMQQPSIESNLNLCAGGDNPASRRRSSVSFQSVARLTGGGGGGGSGSGSGEAAAVTAAVATTSANPTVTIGDASPRGLDQQRRMSKTGSNPGFNLRASPRKGSATELLSGGVGSGTEDANRSFTLSIPSVQQRRHSITNQVGGGIQQMVGGGPNAEIPFVTPNGSKTGSRRPSTQGALTDRLGVAPNNARRSSFNALSDTVMNLFGGANKPG